MSVRMTVVAVSVWLLSGGNTWAAPFTSLYSFGDSLSDAGDSPSAVTSLYKILGNNCDPTHLCPPYFDGRISNGPVASEQLASTLFSGSVTSTNFRSYAVAGAGSGDQNSGFDIGGTLPLPGMKQELDMYLRDSAGAADPGALYFVWGGGNDYLTKDSPVEAAQNIGGYVSTLAAAGARHFLVPNLPDLSLNPFIAGEGDAVRAEARAFSVVFNNELATQLDNVNSHFPAADIFQFDTYSFLNGIVSDPAAYGFVNPQDACLSMGFIPCGNPDAHLYWDDFHPTARAHSIIGSEFAAAVPEPEIGAMLVIGLTVVGFAARQRRKAEQERIGKRGASRAGGV
jgi:phospholipase/lecithinase/hemolysin